MPGKRILVLTHNFIRYPEDPAGQFLHALYQYIEDNYGIYILCPHQKGLKSKEKMGNLNIVRFKYWLPASGENLAYSGDMQEKVQESIFGKIKFVLLILMGAWAAIRLVFRQKIDIIHAHWWIPMGISAWLTSKLTGKRLIITSHGTDIVLLEKGGYLVKIAQKIYDHASRITAVSGYLKQRLTEMTGIMESKVSVFPMPFNVGKFKAENEYSREKGFILSVGRLNYRKGCDYLIKACKILQDDGYRFRLDIIGEGPRRKHLQELIESLGLNNNVRLIGSMPHNKVIEYYHRAELFVLPAIKEGFGLVFVEAIVSGLPVIGAHSGGIPDIIKDNKTGILVPPEDEEQLAQAIKRLLDNPQWAQEIQKAGMEYVWSNFSPEAIAAKLDKLYAN